MKFVSLSIAATAALIFGTSCSTEYSLSSKNVKAQPIGAGKGNTMLVRTTSYSCKENEKGGIYGSKNAVGTRLQYGKIRSAAADWSKYPVGTKFRIVGQPHIYVIDDYGSALVGTRTIDIYKPTLAMMRAWGSRDVQIQILEWGCYHRSSEILKARTHFKHTRTMYQAIQPKLRRNVASAGAPSSTDAEG